MLDSNTSFQAIDTKNAWPMNDDESYRLLVKIKSELGLKDLIELRTEQFGESIDGFYVSCETPAPVVHIAELRGLPESKVSRCKYTNRYYFYQFK